MAVFTKGIYKQYGHIGLVFNGGNTNQFNFGTELSGNANTPQSFVGIITLLTLLDLSIKVRA